MKALLTLEIQLHLFSYKIIYLQCHDGFIYLVRGRTFRLVDSLETDSFVFFLDSERVSCFAGASNSARTGLLLSTCNSTARD